jgi:hypothetical protein
MDGDPPESECGHHAAALARAIRRDQRAHGALRGILVPGEYFVLPRVERELEDVFGKTRGWWMRSCIAAPGSGGVRSRRRMAPVAKSGVMIFMGSCGRERRGGAAAAARAARRDHEERRERFAYAFLLGDRRGWWAPSPAGRPAHANRDLAHLAQAACSHSARAAQQVVSEERTVPLPLAHRLHGPLRRAGRRELRKGPSRQMASQTRREVCVKSVAGSGFGCGGQRPAGRWKSGCVSGIAPPLNHRFPALPI